MQFRNEMHEIDETDLGVKDANERFKRSDKAMRDQIAQVKAKTDKPMRDWGHDEVWSWLLRISGELASGWAGLSAKDKTDEAMKGSEDEIQGRIVEKAFELRAKLAEEEENQKAVEGSNRPKMEHVVKWQNYDNGVESTASKKTVGTILLMKNEKRMIIDCGGNKMIGKAIHAKKTRALKVELKRKSQISELEMANKRLKQGVRKPYIKR